MARVATVAFGFALRAGRAVRFDAGMGGGSRVKC
jgi:hypothetical protein